MQKSHLHYYDDKSFRSWSSALYFGGILVLVTSILYDYKAIKISRFYHTPDNIVKTNDIDVDTLLREKMADPTRIPYLEIVQRNVRRISDIIQQNEQRNIMKAQLLGRAWRLLIPGLGSVIFFIIVSILMKPSPSPI